jgi:hypothetical protein
LDVYDPPSVAFFKEDVPEEETLMLPHFPFFLHRFGLRCKADN